MTSSPNSSITSDTPLPDEEVDPLAVSDAAADTSSSDPTPKPMPKYRPGQAVETQPSSALTAVPVPPRPVHPMPVSFPELDLPTETRLPRPVLPLAPSALLNTAATPLPNPHDIHDGHGGYSSEHLICVRCGSSNLAQGQVVDHGDKFRTLLFAPRRVSLRWLNSVLALLPFRALAKANALACRDCGLVQLTVDPSELRRAERRRD